MSCRSTLLCEKAAILVNTVFSHKCHFQNDDIFNDQVEEQVRNNCYVLSTVIFVYIELRPLKLMTF